MFSILFSSWFMLAFGCIIGAIIGIYASRPRKNSFLKLDPENKRGFEFEIEEETSFSVYTKKMGKYPAQRGIKAHPSYTVESKPRMGRLRKRVVWLFQEGTAYSRRVIKDVTHTYKLWEIIQTLWGKEFFESIPDPQMSQLMEAKIPISIDLNPTDPLTPTGSDKKELPVLSSEDIKSEEDRKASKTFWDEQAKSQRGDMFEKIAFVGAGIGIGLVIALMLGWIPVYQPPSPTPQAQFILRWIM